MKLFGSDGFRSRFGTGTMALDELRKFADSVSFWFQERGFHKPIMIGMDTRASSPIIKSVFISSFNYYGIEVYDIGITPSPGVSYELRKHDCAFGIMITASHNNWTDNGVKFFASNGNKLDAASEDQIEFILRSENHRPSGSSSNIGHTKKIDGSFKRYVDSSLGALNSVNIDKKIIIDCANGALSSVKDNLLAFPFFDTFNDSPNGCNINLNCGALNPVQILKRVRDVGADYGVGFDGDGDRAVFVCKDYGVIESEKIAYLIIMSMVNAGEPFSVASSEIVNMSFKKMLRGLNGSLFEVEAGDRNVIEETNAKGCILGFEPSGHFYFPLFSSSMDGLQALAQFVLALNFHGTKTPDILLEHSIAQRVKIDIPRGASQSGYDFSRLKLEIAEKFKSDSEKIVIRKSMWDPVIRLYYDYEDHNRFPLVQRTVANMLSGDNDDVA